jgi:hypothetical protein
MKLFGALVVVLVLSTSLTNGKTPAFQKKADDGTIVEKAKKLKELYRLCSESRIKEPYKIAFFNAFPSTFEELNELYGYNNHTPAILYSSSYDHIIGLFNNLDLINDTVYYKKIISISINGHWDADAVNAFQKGLTKRTISNPELIVDILQNMPDDTIKSFWRFYFDRAIPMKKIPEPLQKIERINSRMYKMLVDAQTEALKRPE